jgi:integrase
LGAFSLEQLAALGITVAKKPGKILSRQKCKVCGKAGQYELRSFGEGSSQMRLLFCSACGQFPASLFEIKIWWDQKWRWIRHNAQGARMVTYDQAEAALGEIRRQIESGEFNPEYWTAPSRNELIWETFLTGYLKRQELRVKAGRITKATLDKRRSSLINHTTFFNGRNLRGIHAGHLEDWIDSLSLAPKTKLDLAREVGQMFKDALRRELIEKIPALPHIQVTKRKIRWLTAEAQAEILEQMEPGHRPIFLFMMEYGCRPSEAMALEWQDIDWLHNDFTFSRTISRRRTGKATKQRRDNNLPIVNWFEGWLESHPRGLPDQPVFKNTLSRKNRKNPKRRYVSDTLNKIWNLAAAKAGYEGVPLYNAVRHSRGNQARREGWDVGLISRLLGHASTKYVQEYYVDTDSEMVRNQFKKTEQCRSNRDNPTVTTLNYKDK